MLDFDELSTIISRFQSTIYRLQASGDYPEEKTDKELLNKLIDMKYTAMINKKMVTGKGEL